MKTSKFHLMTTRETPADAEIASHQLMLRSGMIRKLTAGIYTWTPLGWRVLKKVERIVREEMDRAGYLELLMPAVQPAELWKETGRWDDFGAQLLKIVLVAAMYLAPRTKRSSPTWRATNCGVTSNSRSLFTRSRPSSVMKSGPASALCGPVNS